MPITFLAAMYFFTKGRFWPFLVCWILALGTIEGAPLFLILFAEAGLVGTLLVPSLSPYWTRRRERQALLVALGVAAAWLVMAYLVLEAVGGRGGGFGSAYAIRYTTLGASFISGRNPTGANASGEGGVGAPIWRVEEDSFLGNSDSRDRWALRLRRIAVLAPRSPAYWACRSCRTTPGCILSGRSTPGLILGFLFVAAIEGTVVIVGLTQQHDSGSTAS